MKSSELLKKVPLSLAIVIGVTILWLFREQYYPQVTNPPRSPPMAVNSGPKPPANQAVGFLETNPLQKDGATHGARKSAITDRQYEMLRMASIAALKPGRQELQQRATNLKRDPKYLAFFASVGLQDDKASRLLAIIHDRNFAESKLRHEYFSMQNLSSDDRRNFVLAKQYVTDEYNRKIQPFFPDAGSMEQFHAWEQEMGYVGTIKIRNQD